MVVMLFVFFGLIIVVVVICDGVRRVGGEEKCVERIRLACRRLNGFEQLLAVGNSEGNDGGGGLESRELGIPRTRRARRVQPVRVVLR